MILKLGQYIFHANIHVSKLGRDYSRVATEQFFGREMKLHHATIHIYHRVSNDTEIQTRRETRLGIPEVS